MSSLTARSLENALNGLRDRDDELCLKTIADDDEINQLEKQVDQDGIELLLRFHPVPSDLAAGHRGNGSCRRTSNGSATNRSASAAGGAS